MSEIESPRYQGENHTGSSATTPYPASRLAPATELVDLAREIAAADNLLDLSSNARLRLIAAQIQTLQNQAQQILTETRRNQRLHRARCTFHRLPGRIYHLYRRHNGDLQFFMVGVDEWGGTPPHRFIGSYRLENDMRWTPVDPLGQPMTEDHLEQNEAMRDEG